MRRHTALQSAIRIAGIPVGKAILAIDRDNASGLLMIGMANAMRDDFAGAEQAFCRLLELDPKSVQGRLWLSRIAVGDGRLADARRWAQEAVGLDPDNTVVLAQLEECNSTAAQFVTIQVCDQAAVDAVKPAVARFGFGVALWAMGRTSDAVWMMERAIEEDPSYLPAILELVALYRKLDEPENELRVAKMAAEIACDSMSQTSLAYALISNGNSTEAEVCLKTAIGMGPHSASELANLGFMHQVLGHVEEATRYLESSIQWRPKQGGPYYWLSQSRKTTEEDRPRIEKMKELSADRTLNEAARESLAYALGKSLEDLGDYEAAMKHFEEGNRLSYSLKFGKVPYDPKTTTPFFDRAREILSSGRVEHLETSTNLSPVPIFIVGMIRSGTTLTEQILSTHPKVGAAGEQPFWSIHRDDVWNDQGLDSERLKSLCEEYCDILKKFGGEKEYVTDKRPDNFYSVGLLSAAFPQAKFIHTRRDPADNCVSIFSTLNASALSWSHSKGSIAHFYGLYRELMEYWHSVLPPGRILDVCYEDLIADTEGVVKGICQFCDLEWDPAMLSPEANSRAVITPSLGQVRRPIYKSSLARWKRYEPWLEEILTLVPESERSITAEKLSM